MGRNSPVFRGRKKLEKPERIVEKKIFSDETKLRFNIYLQKYVGNKLINRVEGGGAGKRKRNENGGKHRKTRENKTRVEKPGSETVNLEIMVIL